MKRFFLVLLMWPMTAGADVDEFVLGLFALERCGFMLSSQTAGADRIEQCRDRFDDLQGLYDALDDDLRVAMQDDWDGMRNEYERALDEPTMFQDHYTADDIRVHRSAMITALGDRAPSPPNPMALAVLMERAAAEYVWRANSVLGGGMATQVLDLSAMVMELDKQFRDLLQRNPNDFQLNQAETQYKFIRNSLINYNQQMVPYLVDRYASSITETLRRAARS